MFTLKFRRNDLETVVCGAKYQKHFRYQNTTNGGPTRVNNATITVYEKLTGEGVDFHIHGADCAHERDHSVCFIENAAGKTIDRVGPFSEGGKVAA